MRGGSERRHFRRFDVEDVFGRLSVRTELEILNMSLTGIAVSSPVAVPPGQDRAIFLGAEDGGTIEIRGKAQRCKMTAASPPRYEIGFDFTEDLGGKASTILRFLEAHIVVDLDRRICGRFALGGTDRAQMHSEVDFEVRRISLSGMLVETDLLIFADEDNVYDLVIDTDGLLLRARGRVAMISRPSPTTDAPLRLGVEFLDLDETQAEALQAFIRDLID